MYTIDLKSEEQVDQEDNPYRTTVRITPVDKESEGILSTSILSETYYLNTYTNPILWLFLGSPHYIYLSSHPPSLVSNKELVGINADMTFRFKSQSHRRYFEKYVVNKLMNFIDKRIKLEHPINQTI